MSFLAFILVSDEIEQLTNFNMLPCIITDLGYQIEVEE